MVVPLEYLQLDYRQDQDWKKWAPAIHTPATNYMETDVRMDYTISVTRNSVPPDASYRLVFYYELVSRHPNGNLVINKHLFFAAYLFLLGLTRSINQHTIHLKANV